MRKQRANKMDYFNYNDQNELYAENLSVKELAREHQTPLYIYSKATLKRHMSAFFEALKGRKHLICYAVKANSTLAILNYMASLGAGFDVVSLGELRRVIKAGGDPHKVIFSGVGKTEEEIAFALEHDILCLNIESEPEVDVISKVAARVGKVARVALRVNPNVDAKTHPSISTGLKNNKFGIAIEKAFDIYKRIHNDKNLEVSGIDCHIGSQMTSGAPILEALDRLIELNNKLKDNGINIDHIDIGGGLGVTYCDETPPSPYEYIQAVAQRLSDTNIAIYVEPGRAMVANAGILVTKILYKKHTDTKNFAIVDAGMNDLIRPALYNSRMNIVEVIKRDSKDLDIYDVVGPVCESDDYLGHDRKLAIESGDYLAVRGAGAYGSSMSSNYNSRPLIKEILVDNDKAHVIRKRQSYEQMWENEQLI